MHTSDTFKEPGAVIAAVDRKSVILAAALAVFTEKGVVAATVDDIRQRSQASVGSIYHHFGTKEGIAAALFMHGLDDYWGRLQVSLQAAPNAERAIHALLETHLVWIVGQPDLARFLFARRQAISADHEQAIRQRTAAHFKALFELFKPWFRQGILRRLPAELYSPLLLGPAQDLARHWLGGRIEFDPLSVIDELSGAAWRSLAVDPSRPGSASAPQESMP
ncbi:TetR/AcrR family transcriptional regulator [Janthinobacterium agaricidamnosum]|uniref:Bacterial regulatory s, tetR family protein n=1 Tax=Janthinobacterium agaricidamnosum NBRC 102515 = DSM 9628 TaxID=1349767 RepID=W0V614_9BURK|nr:TetR/AcrR family transcriptional regulator [Janthinobacterium agaricidamnosum]CDG82707.1 bacterial regulatory s, tetR family protein [Janthinobacterium agaricidamnosum NBRC 102515 = DSM 9628]